MLIEQTNHTQDNAALTAYISEERDREMNTFFLAAICDDAEESLISEVSDYDRDNLIEQVSRKFPGIKIEEA